MNFRRPLLFWLIFICSSCYLVVDVIWCLKTKPILYYVGTGDIPRISQYLNSGNDVNHLFGNTYTMLMISVINKQIPVEKYLLDKGSDPNIMNPEGNTALHLAVKAKSYESMDLLLDARSNPNLKSPDYPGYSALDLSFVNEDVRAARILMKRGGKSDVGWIDRIENSELKEMIRSQHPKAVDR